MPRIIFEMGHETAIKEMCEAIEDANILIDDTGFHPTANQIDQYTKDGRSMLFYWYGLATPLRYGGVLTYKF